MGKTAIVTGASGNVGQAVVKQLVSDGYQVTGTVLHHDPDMKGVPADRYEQVVVNLTDEAESAAFVQKTGEQYGSVDVAVLTVGGFAMGKLADTGTGDVMKQYKLNFETAYNVARPVFNLMMQQGSGRIFLFGSKPGMDAHNSKGMVAYGLAKSLLFRLAALMNDEAKGHNVVASVVVPGTIDTPQNRKSMPDADFSKWVQPEAIAEAIAWYCTPQAAVLREPVIKVYNNS